MCNNYNLKNIMFDRYYKNKSVVMKIALIFKTFVNFSVV